MQWGNRGKCPNSDCHSGGQVASTENRDLMYQGRVHMHFYYAQVQSEIIMEMHGLHKHISSAFDLLMTLSGDVGKLLIM